MTRQTIIDIGAGLVACLAGLTLWGWYVAWRYKREAARIFDALEKERAALNNQLAAVETWSKCPRCQRLVKCEGLPSPVGICRACGRIVTESEIDIADPIRREDDLIQAIAMGRPKNGGRA